MVKRHMPGQNNDGMMALFAWPFFKNKPEVYF